MTTHWRKSSSTLGVEVSDQHPPKYRLVCLGEDGKTYYGAVLALEPTSPTPPPPPPPSTPVPLTYPARTDRNPQEKPPLPELGPASFAFVDAAFGSQMLRLTDALTRPDRIGASYRVQSSAHGTSINADSTLAIVVSTDGAIVPFKIDAVNLRATRLPVPIVSQVEPQFSRIDPDVIYVNGGASYHSIIAQNLSTGAKRLLVDLGAWGMPADAYVGGLTVGGSPEFVVSHYGGNIIDAHYRVMWIPVDGSTPSKILDTMERFSWHIHAIQVDRTGRYVFIYPAGADRIATMTTGGAYTIAQVYLWDTKTDAVTPLWSHPSGHDSAGYGVWVNQDCCTSSPWDAGQWQIRKLATPDQTADLIGSVLTPKEIYLADHTSWNNAQPDRYVPVLSSTYRFGEAIGQPARAWSDEIIAIATDGSGTVWRFAHHRTDVRQDANAALLDFWYEPLVTIAPNGRWALFSSNWEKTLGTDQVDFHHRQDVFLLQLA